MDKYCSPDELLQNPEGIALYIDNACNGCSEQPCFRMKDKDVCDRTRNTWVQDCKEWGKQWELNYHQALRGQCSLFPDCGQYLYDICPCESIKNHRQTN